MENVLAQEVSSKKKLLGTRLIEAGLLNDAQLDLAVREQQRNGGYLGDMLVHLGFITPDVLAAFLAEEAQTSIVDVSRIVVDENILKLVPYETAKRFDLFPIHLEGDMLTVAMADPFDVIAIDHLEKNTGLCIDVVGATKGSIMEALERYQANGRSIEETIDQILSAGVTGKDEEDMSLAPMVRLVDQIIALGIKSAATDMHITPEEKIIRIRIRVDGILQQAVLMPSSLRHALTARLKIIAGLKITEKRIPQDGRIRFLFGRRKVDLRVSTLPCNFGENIVLRILDQGTTQLDLSSMGLSKYNKECFSKALKRSYGIVLVTGPTGSGKTTTLYAALNQINSTEKSIFTLEDPIEYQLPLVRQMQVNNEVGLTFAKGLRSLLRQDPDIILVGEIRDAETAELAVRAALTGHLVFSTLHTNDAVGVIPRLIDMGIAPYLLLPSLVAVLAQRLVRRICPNCKEELANGGKRIKELGLDMIAPTSGEMKLWHGSGCADCQDTGYQGRLSICEMMMMDERFHDTIMNGANSMEILKLAKEGGMKTMYIDGIEKAMQGLTTLDEVLRVVGNDA